MNAEPQGETAPDETDRVFTRDQELRIWCLRVAADKANVFRDLKEEAQSTRILVDAQAYYDWLTGKEGDR